jgi:AraC family transcriptional regulator, arabinose operon regulatory protein
MDNIFTMDNKFCRVHAYFVHTPVASYEQIFYSVTVAARCEIGPDYPEADEELPGHDLVLSLAGTAAVQIGNRVFSLNAGELGWINCYNPNIKWPRRTGPWEFVWVRFDSPQSNSIAAALGVERNPVFKLKTASAALSLYRTIFRLMRTRPVAMDAELHAAVSSLIALFFKSRQAELSQEPLTPPQTRGKPNLAQLLDILRTQCERHWAIKDISRVAGISVPQLFRLFAKATGSTPMDWLRRERINRAKHQLVETRDRIGEIAEGVGYSDQLYFSRDFKKVVGVSPREFRRREQVATDLIRRNGH